MKKNILSIILSLLCICNLSFAQNTRNKPMRLDSSANSSKGQDSNLLNDMILSSIKSYIEWNNNLNKGKSADLHYICIDGIPSDFPYDSLQNVRYGSLKNVGSWSRKAKNSLKKGICFKFVSLKVVDDRIIITITSRVVKRVGKKEIRFELVMWGNYIYRYSYEHKKWELLETTYGGV